MDRGGDGQVSLVEREGKRGGCRYQLDLGKPICGFLDLDGWRPRGHLSLDGQLHQGVGEVDNLQEVLRC